MAAAIAESETSATAAASATVAQAGRYYQQWR